MAKKKVSDTLSQQRKARKDFLELKKMQSGEIQAGPKPSEIALKPKTFKDKAKNFWFHHKWHTLGSIFAALSLAILIGQCASRTNWDMQVMYFTYTPVLDEQLEPVADYLESISKDLNGDGEVNIQIINCSTPTAEENYQLNHSVLSKLQSIMAAGNETVLYITDSDSAEYFNNENIVDFFATEQQKLGPEFYAATAIAEYGSLPDGLQIACRRIKNTALSGSKKLSGIYDEAVCILENLEK